MLNMCQVYSFCGPVNNKLCNTFTDYSCTSNDQPATSLFTSWHFSPCTICIPFFQFTETLAYSHSFFFFLLSEGSCVVILNNISVSKIESHSAILCICKNTWQINMILSDCNKFSFAVFTLCKLKNKFCPKRQQKIMTDSNNWNKVVSHGGSGWCVSAIWTALGRFMMGRKWANSLSVRAHSSC